MELHRLIFPYHKRSEVLSHSVKAWGNNSNPGRLPKLHGWMRLIKMEALPLPWKKKFFTANLKLLRMRTSTSSPIIISTDWKEVLLSSATLMILHSQHSRLPASPQFTDFGRQKYQKNQSLLLSLTSNFSLAILWLFKDDFVALHKIIVPNAFESFVFFF